MMLSTNRMMSSTERKVRRPEIAKLQTDRIVLDFEKNRKCGRKSHIVAKEQRLADLSALRLRVEKLKTEIRSERKKSNKRNTKRANDWRNKNSLVATNGGNHHREKHTKTLTAKESNHQTELVAEISRGGRRNKDESPSNHFDPTAHSNTKTSRSTPNGYDRKNICGLDRSKREFPLLHERSNSRLNLVKKKRKAKPFKAKVSAEIENYENSKSHLNSVPSLDKPSLRYQSKSTISPTVRTKKHLFENAFNSKTGLLSSNRSPVDKSSSVRTLTQGTPKTLQGGFVDLNKSCSPPFSTRGRKSPKPPKRFFESSHCENGRGQGFIDSALSLLVDKSKENEVRSLIEEIDNAGGFPVTRRLSLRDNELVGEMMMVIRNDPGVESIDVPSDLFGTISSTLVNQFVSSLRMNLHLKSITFSGVELGNDFLYNLASSMESNFAIEEINLSRNLFTNAGLAEFCQIVATSNETCKKLNLENQTTPISKASEVDVLDAFRQNKTLQDIKIDFQSERATECLKKIMYRNKDITTSLQNVRDEKLLELLRHEAERAKELFVEKQKGDTCQASMIDWNYLYSLSIQFDRYKLRKHVQETSEGLFVPSVQTQNGDSMTKEQKKKFLFGKFRKNLGDSICCFTSDGSFLNDSFISKYLVYDAETNSSTFDFHGQWKLFRRFPLHDPARHLIVTKFVDALTNHPRGNEITEINMASSGCGDDFLVCLADRCLRDPSVLPNLLILNFETNFINEDGVTALARVIESKSSLRFLQVIRLENQKFLLKSRAEFALARAMRVNMSVVAMGLRLRNLTERQQINKYILRNVELIRQARQRYLNANGKQRERNEVELFFDRISDNDENIMEANLVDNQRFLTLRNEEKLKAAQSFANNTYVNIINFNGCGIDDDFAICLSSSLKRNTAVKKVLLEGNNISGIGIIALFEALAENSTIEELRVHKQSKPLNTSEEQKLNDIIQPNTTLTKLGVDLRTKVCQVQLDKKLGLNRNKFLKLRAESKGASFQPVETHSFLIKF